MGISESGWLFSIILAHPMLLSRLRVPGPPGPLSSGMGFVSCLCGSRGRDENAWATFFLLPLSVAFSLLNTSAQQRWDSLTVWRFALALCQPQGELLGRRVNAPSAAVVRGFVAVLVQEGLLKNSVLQFFSCTEKEAGAQESK